MIKIILFGAVCGVFLAGCITTQDLSQADSGLNEQDLHVADQLATLTVRRCTKVATQNGVPSTKVGTKITQQRSVITRLFTSNDGWYKAESRAEGITDYVYLNQFTGRFICGEVDWLKEAVARTTVFQLVEAGKSNRGVQGSNVAPLPPSSETETANHAANKVEGKLEAEKSASSVAQSAGDTDSDDISIATPDNPDMFIANELKKITVMYEKGLIARHAYEALLVDIFKRYSSSNPSSASSPQTLPEALAKPDDQYQPPDAPQSEDASRNAASKNLDESTADIAKAPIKKPVDVAEQSPLKMEDVKTPSSDVTPVGPALKVHAIVIGNGSYQGSGRLENPINDARAISTKLKGMGFKVTLVENADRNKLVSSLVKFSSSAADSDLTLFFYAGHGVQISGTNYMLPTDTNLNQIGGVPLHGISLNSVVEQFLPGKTKLVFLDACRDNPLLQVASRSVSRGLAPISVSQGTLISYATKDGSVAADGDGKNSPFTKALLQYIDDPDDIAVVLRKVRDQVMRDTGGQQQPWEYGSLSGGSLILSAIKAK